LIIPILVLVAIAGLTVLAFIVVLKATRRWLGARWEIGFSLAASVYLVYDWASLNSFCSAEPTYIAPTDAEAAAGSEGMMIFNCDAPGGMFDYFYLQLLGPGLIVITLILTFRALLHLREPSTSKSGGVM